jgi:secreted PhoX family phosphatase
MTISRRQFAMGGASLAAFAGLSRFASVAAATSYHNQVPGYGPLRDDPAGLIDLPHGFSYRVISSAGDRMDDGLTVPCCHDGMGCFPLDAERVVLVRNHELLPDQRERGAKGAIALAYDRYADGGALPGGTSSMIYNLRSGRVERQHLSLAGTIRNCSGGVMPWGSWLSCEEILTRAGEDGVIKDHGLAFEVPASAGGLVAPVPIRALGRFNHEGAVIDPRTGILYLTEDEKDSLFYRFLPDRPGALHHGGRLQALGFREQMEGGDSRNWKRRDIAVGEERRAVWIDLDGVDNPHNDLKNRGHASGAAIFARGEGIYFGDGQVHFMCTSGGAAGLGQIFRYSPSPFEGQPGERDDPGRLSLFVESDDRQVLNYGDNITVAPWGHLIVCEDNKTAFADNMLRGVTGNGRVYTLGRVRGGTEPTGACFSPDGRVLFLNIYAPGKTLAITGPWERVVQAGSPDFAA